LKSKFVSQDHSKQFVIKLANIYTGAVSDV
jgi:hypothetical protein